MNKILLCPHRKRKFPARFGWVDAGLLGHPNTLPGLRQGALALYLVLVLVSDAQGISYYSDKRLCQMLGCAMSTLKEARSSLIKADLIAFARPLYQLLSLPECTQDTPECCVSAEEFKESIRQAGLLL